MLNYINIGLWGTGTGSPGSPQVMAANLTVFKCLDNALTHSLIFGWSVWRQELN